MNTEKRRLFLLFILGAAAGIFGMYLHNNYKIERKTEVAVTENRKQEVSKTVNSIHGNSIEKLTNESTVINFVKSHHELPDYYITKSEAKKQGWIPSKGNLCDVLPGNAIGGDNFSNREKTLPKNGKYYEADVNYNCGNRNADRIVFTKNGDVWLTKNHYKTFEKQ